MSDQPLFDDLDGELEKAYNAEQGDMPSCYDVITLEHIVHDIGRFTDEQIPATVRQEMLELLSAGAFEVKFQHRLGKRFKGSAAIVHFKEHIFSDELLYLLYYSAQFLDNVLFWQLQAAFHVSEIFPYHCDE